MAEIRQKGRELRKEKGRREGLRIDGPFLPRSQNQKWNWPIKTGSLILLLLIIFFREKEEHFCPGGTFPERL